MADARTRRANPAAPVDGGDTITSTDGDGFGTNPVKPMAAPPPIVSKQGDGFGSYPSTPMPAPPPITSTQGDGFGSQPSTPLPTPASSPGMPDFGTIPGLNGVPYGTPASSPVPGVGAAPLSPVPAASVAPRVSPMSSNGAPSAPANPTAASGAVGLTPTDPNNPLTAQTITPGSLADRFKLAQDRFQTFANSTEPAYQAALRDSNRFAAAAGGLGSGQARTSLGDLALNRTRDLTNSRDNLFQNALEGSIGDTWNTIGLAERQQGFQNQQQQQAFEQALQQFMAGQSGGTGAATRTAYGMQVAGQGQDALAAVNQWARNYVPPAPQRPQTPPFNPSAPQGGF